VNKKKIIQGAVITAIAALGVVAFIYLKKKFLDFLNTPPAPQNESDSK